MFIRHLLVPAILLLWGSTLIIAQPRTKAHITKTGLKGKKNKRPVLPCKNEKKKSSPTAPINFLSTVAASKQINIKQIRISIKARYHQLINQSSPYDVKADLASFIKKLRIDDGFVIENKSRRTAHLQVQYEAKELPEFYKTATITVKPGEYHVFDRQEGALVKTIQLAPYDPALFLNPKFTQDGYLQISIEHTQDRYFLHQHHPFDFTTRKFTDEELNDTSLHQDERTFRAEFNGSCDYLDYMGNEEGTSLAEIDEQRRNLYAKNNITAIVKQKPAILDASLRKIPLITHKIWVTSDAKPCNPSAQYIQWLIQSIEHNPVSAGWTHNFWIESKQKLPELTRQLENHPNIRLRELSELDTSKFVTGALYKEAINQNKFGKASDIIRLELLKLFGGYYLDTDYELFQSLIPYSKVYDLIVGLEPMSAYLCNAFIGARPNHPVIDKALTMINRNIGTDAPQYIKDVSNTGFKTIIETGPAMFTAAFSLAAGQNNNVDVVLPPQTIYPARADLYPYKHVVVPNGKIPAQAIGAHYWNTAWMDPKFGSQG